MMKHKAGLAVATFCIGVMTSTLAWTGCGGDAATTANTVDSGGGKDSATQQDTSTPVLDGSGGNDTGNVGMDGGMGNDASDAPTMFANDGAVLCPSQACAAGTVCCAIPDGGVSLQCLAQCPNGGAPIACESPAGCGGSTPACCGTIVVSGGQPPNCSVSSVSAACTATCMDMVTFSCMGTDTVHFCSKTADCATDGTNTSCCLFAQAPQPFCVNAQLKGFAKSCTQ